MTTTEKVELRLDCRERRLYPPKPHPTARSKAVTIAIGFCAEEAIVLAADRLITSSFGTKYKRKKVFPFFGHDWCIGLTYAGYCDVFDSVKEKLEDQLPSCVAPSPSFRSICALVEGLLVTVRKDHGIKMVPQFLLAISLGPEIRLYKSESAIVSPGGSWKCFGFGESPLTHYLVELLMSSSRDRFDKYEAMLLASYVVAQANRYVDKCEGGPDLLVVRPHGVVEVLRRAPPVRLLRSLASLNREIAETWGAMCELAKDDQQFLTDMQDISSRLAKVRRELTAIPLVTIRGA